MQTLLVPRSKDVVDQIPAGVYEVINHLFTTRLFPASKCDRMLENLLRYAQAEQQGLERHDRCAVVVIHNLLKTYHVDREMQETCCYQTLHTFVRLLSTLGILKKQGSADQPTTYLLPLDADYRFQASAAVLAALDRLCDAQHTKNPKMRKKAREVKIRLLLMKAHIFPVARQQSLLERIHSLVDSLHLSATTTATLAQKVADLCANAMQESTGYGVPVDSSPLLPGAESTRDSIPVDSSSDGLAKESTNDPTPVDSFSALLEQGDPSFEHEKRKESTSEEKNLPDVALSSIEYLSLDRSLGKELELESLAGGPWTDSEDELSQEAAQYLMLLDGPEYATADYVNTHAGKQAIGGYKNKIRRSPRLARTAAINALLQRSFYDLTRQKEPLKNAGKWFHRSFDRYVDPHRPMEITGEILDWAKSPYTLQEIALALPRERKRQETQWWSSEAAHLPFSSCVRIYQHLQDDGAALPLSVAMEQREIFSGETARCSTKGSSMELSASLWMSLLEAEQLADEIRREASWYLEGIHVSLEPHLGVNAHVVEASTVEMPYPVTYPSRQDWWLHHQEQVGHQRREERKKGGTYAGSTNPAYAYHMPNM